MNDLVQKLKRLAQEKETFVIVIDGMSAAGKSTFALKLASVLDANLIQMDDFFLPKELRTSNRYQESGGNIHYERFKEEVINHLGESISYGVFDCKSMKILKQINLLKKKFIIIEGAYSMHPYFGNYYDYAIFMKIDLSLQLKRIKLRNPNQLDSFQNQWIPLENQYFNDYQIEQKCNEVFKNVGYVTKR